jgi:hypothetical protein
VTQQVSSALPPNLTWTMTVHVDVAAAVEAGAIHGTKRRIIPIVGGSFEGPRLAGSILPHGADWQHTRTDGVVVLEARYTLVTNHGQVIGVVNRGFRHGAPDLAARLASGVHVPPEEYYFMTTPVFETAAPELQWLTRTIFVGAGKRSRDSVVLDVWQVGDEPCLS